MGNPANLSKFTSENAAIMGAKGGTNKKGAVHLSTWIQEMMEDESFTGEYIEGYTLKKHIGAPVKALVRVAFLKSMGGDQRWADWLAKYGYGTKLQLSNDPDNPITPLQQLNNKELDAYINGLIAGAAAQAKGSNQGAQPADSKD
jgi:hypothetical protein